MRRCARSGSCRLAFATAALVACSSGRPPASPAPPAATIPHHVPAGGIRVESTRVSAPDAPVELPGPAPFDAPELVPPLPETGHPFQEPLPPRELDRSSPAFRAANLSPGSCLAELRRRALPFGRAGRAAQGVAVPVRIEGPLRGVRFLTPGRKSVYGILDCRLALVLDELAAVLQAHGVVSVRVDNVYRPRARLPGRRKSSQHRYGLAIDIVAFELTGGDELSVERDWRGGIGGAACGPESRLDGPTERAIALRNIVCDVARQGLFHHLLTPNHDAAHRDHLHLDVKRGETRWIMN